LVGIELLHPVYPVPDYLLCPFHTDLEPLVVLLIAIEAREDKTHVPKICVDELLDSLGGRCRPSARQLVRQSAVRYPFPNASLAILEHSVSNLHKAIVIGMGEYVYGAGVVVTDRLQDCAVKRIPVVAAARLERR
jgi:hypothetical protein